MARERSPSEVETFLRLNFPGHRLLEPTLEKLIGAGLDGFEELSSLSTSDLEFLGIPFVFRSALLVSHLEIRHKSKSLAEELRQTYDGYDPSFLWDMASVYQCVRPTSHYERAVKKGYEYIGRAGGGMLWEKLNQLQAGQRCQVLGAKGSGKSTVIRTAAGYGIGSGTLQVVYVQASRFIEDPFTVLLGALLVVVGEVASLLKAGTIEQVVAWCKERRRGGSLLFAVDDWDKFEKHPEAEDHILKASGLHILVKVSSINSRERWIWLEDDKGDDEIVTLEFDGPYNKEELQTWISRSELSADDLQNMEFLTGFMPRLLRYYEECRGVEKAFVKKVEDFYTKKLYDRFIKKLETAQDLQRGLRFVLLGTFGAGLKGKSDLTCFYRDKENRYHVLSPYLRSNAEFYIMEQQARLVSKLAYSDIEYWAEVVRRECEADSVTNPARVGWNVEGLVIAVARFRNDVFGFKFKTYRSYAHGGELEELQTFSKAVLEGGVLMGPKAFNEMAIDLVYIILVENVLHVKGIQITIAQWKAKEKKQSHVVWKNQVLPKWKISGCTQAAEFYYVMPHSVTLLDVAAGPFFKRLGDLDNCLAPFDALLSLREPDKIEKQALQICKGLTMDGRQCTRSRCCNTEYWCHHHVGQRT